VTNDSEYRDYKRALTAITEDVSAFAAAQYPKILKIRKAVIAAGDISDEKIRHEALKAEITDLSTTTRTHRRRSWLQSLR
jgi:hypothetical protein